MCELKIERGSALTEKSYYISIDNAISITLHKFGSNPPERLEFEDVCEDINYEISISPASVNEDILGMDARLMFLGVMVDELREYLTASKYCPTIRGEIIEALLENDVLEWTKEI